jgi:hypothetical protein
LCKELEINSKFWSWNSSKLCMNLCDTAQFHSQCMGNSSKLCMNLCDIARFRSQYKEKEDFELSVVLLIELLFIIFVVLLHISLIHYYKLWYRMLLLCKDGWRQGLWISLYYIILKRIWDSVVGIVTGLQAGSSGISILARARDFSILQIVQTSVGAHPASCPVGTVLFSEGWSGGGVMLPCHLHLVLRLTINRAVALLSLYSFMVWTGISLPFMVFFSQFCMLIFRLNIKLHFS